VDVNKKHSDSEDTTKLAIYKKRNIHLLNADFKLIETFKGKTSRGRNPNADIYLMLKNAHYHALSKNEFIDTKTKKDPNNKP